jgi:hypothetical protein
MVRAVSHGYKEVDQNPRRRHRPPRSHVQGIECGGRTTARSGAMIRNLLREGSMRKLSFPALLLLLTAGCVVYQEPTPTYTIPYAPAPAVTYQAPPLPVEPAPIVYQPPPPAPVVSVYVEPPIDEPAPVAAPWAPPPMLVEEPPPPPYPDAVWIGGFWVWQGTWVWDHGRWAEPPRRDYVWVHPYYENRHGVVIFITGHWAPVGVAFVPPAPGVYIAVERPLAGIEPGPACEGPEGVFVPPPPGSRRGIIVPAPIGTAPAVVTSAPPVVNVGMRITNNVNSNNTTVNNVTNVTNVTNITRVTIVAPASATATGQAVNTSVPAQAHLAAAMAPTVRVAAPPPASQQAIPAFTRGRPPVALPPPQVVHAIVQPQPRRPIAPSPVAAPAAQPPAAAARPAPPEMTRQPGPREAFDRQEREPRAAQPAPTPQPSPYTAAPAHAPAPASTATPNPYERQNERHENVQARPSGPAPKPAPPAPAHPQNAQEARKDKPAHATQGDQKREANEKEKQNESRKEGER